VTLRAYYTPTQKAQAEQRQWTAAQAVATVIVAFVKTVATVIVAFVKNGPSQSILGLLNLSLLRGVDQACFNLALKGV
jgi:hypothetical protein